MKKLMLFFGLLMLTITLIGQDKKYELYQCKEVISRFKSNGTWSEWEVVERKTELILRLCITDSKLEFNNSTNIVFFVAEVTEVKNKVDSEGDEFVESRWIGFDQDGSRCHVVSIDYTSLPYRNFILEYSDIEIFFSCIILNPKSI